MADLEEFSFKDEIIKILTCLGISPEDITSDQAETIDDVLNSMWYEGFHRGAGDRLNTKGL